MKILLNGYKGRMGQAIIAASTNSNSQIAFKTDVGDNPEEFISNADCVIDFSFRDSTESLAKLCSKYKKPLVIGTTGHTSQQKKEILEYAKNIPIVWAGNYSIGVNLLNYLVSIAAKILPQNYNIEIIEMHHNLKKDAPSGTAEKLIDITKNARGLSDNEIKHGRDGLVGERPEREIGVHSLRGGSVVGDHSVIFAGQGERLELTHLAGDRNIFATGSIRAAEWLVGKPAGLYGMDDVLGIK